MLYNIFNNKILIISYHIEMGRSQFIKEKKMKKIAILLAVLVFGVVGSASAQVPVKPFTIYGAAGLSSPTSPDGFKDGYNMGYHADAQLGFNAFPKTEFLLNLGYHTFGADFGDLTGYDGGTMSFILAGGDLKLNLGVPLAPVKPFVFAGAGLAVLSMSDLTTPLGTGSFESINKFYFEIGGGVEFTQFFVRVKYVSVATEGDSFALIPLSIGMKF